LSNFISVHQSAVVCACPCDFIDQITKHHHPGGVREGNIGDGIMLRDTVNNACHVENISDLQLGLCVDATFNLGTRLLNNHRFVFAIALNSATKQSLTPIFFLSAPMKMSH
jgi:hypothetical protein